MNTLIVRTAVLLFCLGVVCTETALSDPLQQYALKCDRAIGITVPNFNCDHGTKVPTTHPKDSNGNLIPTDSNGDPIQDSNGNPIVATCDRPNVLNTQCDPKSRFQVLPTSNADAYAVAHCRKEGLSQGHYADIAIIQHNQKNGATCFYQALGNLDGTDVKAPSLGVGTPPFWLTPAAIEGSNFRCGRCHDNGPIIRSPYLSQVVDSAGKRLLPGAWEDDTDPANSLTFNNKEPYFFVGNDFASWKAYKVEVEQSDVVHGRNPCNQCHRMGVNNLTRDCRRQDPEHCTGTALDLGIRATNADQSEPTGRRAKNRHSPDSPIWMPPPGFTQQFDFDQKFLELAQEIRECALKFFNETPLPNSPSCRITLYSGGIADIDGDGDVDRNDLEILLQDQGKSVSQSACGVRCDLDGDGQISNLDVRELILLCSRSNCATQ